MFNVRWLFVSLRLYLVSSTFGLDAHRNKYSTHSAQLPRTFDTQTSSVPAKHVVT
jgi:hypothetical protein